MRDHRKRFGALLCAFCATVAMLGCGGGEQGGGASGPGGFDASRAFADLRAQVEIGPRPAGSEASRELVALLARKLREAGAEQVTVQRPWRNVVGILPGSEPGYLVIGAHHDTKDDVPGLLGANDGASGVAVVLELARSLPRPLPGPSIAVALFDAEEARGDRPFALDGKRGSTQYVELAERGGGPGTPPLEQIRAAVIFDMVGDCDLQIPLEALSDPGLYEHFAEADPEVFSGRTTAIDDDHVPFLDAGVPAVDLIDFTYGPGPMPGEWWHSDEDTLDKVCPGSLDVVGEAALLALPELG